MPKGCPDCEALERELVKLQTIRLNEVKESDVFKVMYAKFSQVIPEVQKISWKQGAKAMQENIAEHLRCVFDDEVAEFARNVPMEEEDDADLQLSVPQGMHRKKDFDA
jgi:hypothetical protein